MIAIDIAFLRAARQRLHDARRAWTRRRAARRLLERARVLEPTQPGFALDLREAALRALGEGAGAQRPRPEDSRAGRPTSARGIRTVDAMT